MGPAAPKPRVPRALRRHAARLGLVKKSSKHTAVSADLRKQLKEACNEASDLHHVFLALKKAYNTLDDALAIHYPLKLQPWSAQGLEIEDIQRDLLVSAEFAGKRLDRLRDIAEDLEAKAKLHSPDLLRDTILLKSSLHDSDFDYVSFLFSLKIGLISDHTKKYGMFVEDRPDVLHGPPPSRPPINNRPAEQERIRTCTFNGHEQEQAKRNIKDDYRNHAYSVRFSNLFEEDFEIVDGQSSLDDDIRRFETTSNVLVHRSRRPATHAAHMRLAKELLELVLSHRERVKTFAELQQSLRQDYAAAGPGNPEIDVDMRYYQTKSLSALTWADRTVARLTEFTRKELVPRPETEASRRDICVLDGIKLSLRPHLIEPGVLEASVRECTALNGEDQDDHQYWYKGLHPLAEKIHASFHDVRRLAVHFSSFEKPTGVRGLLRFPKSPTEEELQTCIKQAEEYQADVRDLDTLCKDPGALPILTLQSEILAMYGEADNVGQKAEGMLTAKRQ